VECGVPKSSIAILTPYKGQMVLIRHTLIQMNLYQFRYNQLFNGEDSCRLSTVDRFQGDEADIVIISLVLDANSRTAFVKQVNRMIVLLSRARLEIFCKSTAH
jgi:superfamily I DNA and/or RNA helicase